MEPIKADEAQAVPTPESLRERARILRAEAEAYRAKQEQENNSYGSSAPSSECASAAGERLREAEACELRALQLESARLAAHKLGTEQACAARALALREDLPKLAALLASFEDEARAAEAVPTLRGYYGLVTVEDLEAQAQALRAQLRASEDEAEACEALAKRARAALAPKPKRIVRSVEVDSLGLEHYQYFNGAGSHGFDEVAVGIGNSEREAVADALEQFGFALRWEFKPEDGFPSEPCAADYSDEDEVGKAEAEALESELPTIAPVFALRFYAFNGLAWSLREDLESEDEARTIAREYLEAKRAEGYEVSELQGFGATATAWESMRADSGVTDSEGTLSLVQSNAEDCEEREAQRERYSDNGSELHYFAAVRVSQAPDGREDEDGAVEYEAEDGREYLYCESYEVAQACALRCAREILWAFKLSWLRTYFAPEIRDSDEAIQALAQAQEKLCESFAPIARALLGSREDEALRAALAADGFGHYLAHYDSEELRDSDGAYRYRTN